MSAEFSEWFVEWYLFAISDSRPVICCDCLDNQRASGWIITLKFGYFTDFNTVLVFSDARLIWVNVSSQVKVETERGIYFYTSTVFQEYRGSYITTNLSNVSAIQARKVLDSSRIIGSKELLELSYEMGDYPYPEKISLEEYESDKQLLQIELLKVQARVVR